MRAMAPRVRGLGGPGLHYAALESVKCRFFVVCEGVLVRGSNFGTL